MHHMSVTINSVIGSLAHDKRLKALHTFLRTQYDENPDKIILDYICGQRIRGPPRGRTGGIVSIVQFREIKQKKVPSKGETTGITIAEKGEVDD